MTIRCEHVHRLELRKYFKLWAAVARQRSKCAESPIYQLFLYFLFWTCMSEIKFRPYFSLNWQMRNTKLKKKLKQI